MTSQEPNNGDPKLIGRGPQIATAIQALTTTTKSVVLVGEHGVGLSVLLAEIVTRLRPHDRKHLHVIDDIDATPTGNEQIQSLLSGQLRVVGTVHHHVIPQERLDELYQSHQVAVINVEPLRVDQIAELLRGVVSVDVDPVSLDRISALTCGLPKLINFFLEACQQSGWFIYLPGGLVAIANGLPKKPGLIDWARSEVEGIPYELAMELAATGPIPVGWCGSSDGLNSARRASVLKFVQHDSFGHPLVQLHPPLIAEILRVAQSREAIGKRCQAVLDRSGLCGDKAVAHPIGRRLLAQLALCGRGDDAFTKSALAGAVADGLTAGDPEVIQFAELQFSMQNNAATALDLSLAFDHAGHPNRTLEVARQAEVLAATDTERAIAIDRQASALVRLGRTSEAVETLGAGLGHVSDDEASTRLQVSLVNRMLHAGQVNDVTELVTPYLNEDACPQAAFLVASIAASAQGQPAQGARLAHLGMIAGRVEVSNGMLAERLLTVAQAVAALELGHLDEAQNLADKLVDNAIAERNRPMQGWSGVISGWIALARGDAMSATSQFRSAVSGFTGVGEPVYLAWSVAGLSAALALRASVDESRYYESEYEKLGVEPHELFALEAERALALGALWRGETKAAATRLQQAIIDGARSHQWSQVLAVGIDSMLLPFADRSDVSQLMSHTQVREIMEHAATQVDGPLPRARVEAWNVLDQLGSALDQRLAIGALAACGSCLTATRLAIATVANGGDDRSRARSSLRALALISQCTGVHFATAGLTPPRVGKRPRLVATMAAEGMSRQLIADHLALSRKTVDRHLSDVYMALGIHGKSELKDALVDLSALAPFDVGSRNTGRLDLVDRDQEIASVRHLWQQGRRGVQFYGEAGVGRSRLLEECAAMFSLAGCQVVRIAGALSAHQALGSMAQRTSRRVVILVDDAHLLSQTAREAVRVAATVESAFVVATLIAPMNGGGNRGHPAPLMDGMASVAVQPLSDEAILQMAEKLLGAVITAGSRRTLVAAVRGCPRTLQELVRSWLSLGVLHRGRDGFSIELATPVLSMQAMARQRFDSASNGQRRALQILAALGTTPQVVLAEMVGSTVVRELVNESVIVDVDGEIDFAHEFHRDVFLSELDRDATRIIASEVCDFCLRDDGDQVDPVRAASWLLLARRDVSAERLLDAARYAWRLSDYESAKSLLIQAVERGAGWQATVLMAEVAVGQGDRASANRLLKSLASDGHPLEARVAAALVRSDFALWIDGDADAAEASLRIEGLDAPDASIEVQAMVADQRGLIEVAGRNRIPRADMGGIPSGLAEAGMFLLTGKSALGAKRCQMVLDELGDVERRHLLADNLMSLQVECLMEAGDINRANATMRMWRPEATWSSGIGLGRPAGAAVRIMLRRGMVARSGSLIAGALRDPCVTPGSQSWFWLQSCAALAYAMSGDAKRATSALDTSDGVPQVGVLVSVVRTRAAAWANVAAGDFRGACRILVDAGERYMAIGLVTPAAQMFHDALRIDGSDVIARSLEEVATGMEGVLADARCSHARSVLSDDPLEGLEAAKLLVSAGADLVAAELALGLVPRLAKLRNSKASRDARRLGRDLRERCVGAATPGLLTPSVALTPRQLEIARIASTGLTSRQIGERLGVSVRTVENQLQRTYERLGIPGRDRLAEALRQGADAPLL